MEKYLKPNVVIEPLIDSWYAWSHLVSPATAALNITKRHMVIMESYLSNPESHEQAVLDPKMKGGPFMDLGGRRLEEVQALWDKTIADRKDMLDLANSIAELGNMLRTLATGYSLESIYKKVPETLKGFVELYYDLNNNASFRLFEPLLYRSKYNNPKSQNIALWITNNDHRPFCLSTPRLDNDPIIRLDIRFDDPVVDELAKMKRTAQSVDHIKDRIEIPAERKADFEFLFTDEAPALYRKYEGKKIRTRYFGHACVLVETEQVSILLDPVISYYGYHSDVEHFSDVDLPDTIDYAMITHNHQDHILLETLLPLRHKIKNLIIPCSRGGRLEDPQLKLMLNAIGFRNVVEMDEMQTITFCDAAITGIPFTGEHCDLNILSKLCYHVQIGKFSLLFMADSRVIEAAVYRNIFRQIGKVDVIFLGMECDGAPLSWLYGPLIGKKLSREQDNSRRLAGSDCEMGMALIDIFSPREVYVYAMGQEPWLEFISSIKYNENSNPIVQSNKLIAECVKRGIIAERLFGEKEILYEIY
jgi:L-ascorbate metabolism protein UlaG (beta-lactamase superfamily)